MSDDQAAQGSTEAAQTDDTSVITDGTGDQVSGEKDQGEKSHEETFYPDQEDADDSGDDKEQESTDDKESKDSDDDKSEGDDADAESKDDDKEKSEPGEYQLAKPKESKLTDADMERIESYAKDQGLSKEAAEKLVQSESEARDSYFESLQAEHREQVKQWVDDVRADKELGGENFGKTAELAKSVVDRFGTEKFREDLNTSGYGNHPEVVRIFARIGKAMAPDTIVKENNPSTGQRSLEETFYPTQSQ